MSRVGSICYGWRKKKIDNAITELKNSGFGQQAAWIRYFFKVDAYKMNADEYAKTWAQTEFIMKSNGYKFE